MTPLTGDAGFIGTEQLSWAKYAVKTLAPKYGLKMQLVRATPRSGARRGVVVAQKYIADPKVLVAIGPSTSGAVAAASNARSGGHRPDLAVRNPDVAHQGQPARRRPTSSSAWCRTTGSRARRRALHGQQAQGQEGRRRRLPGAVLGRSRRCDRADAQGEGRHGAASVGERQHVRLLADRDEGAERRRRRVLRHPAAADAQTFAQQLLEQGKKAKVFAGDGANDPDKFKVARLVRVELRCPIGLFPYNKAHHRGWKKDNPNATLGSFGPPDLRGGRRSR